MSDADGANWPPIQPDGTGQASTMLPPVIVGDAGDNEDAERHLNHLAQAEVNLEDEDDPGLSMAHAALAALYLDRWRNGGPR